MKKTTSIVLALLGFVGGLALTPLIIGSGVEKFQQGSIERFVAIEAYNMTWQHVDNPIERALMPAARVVRVEPRSGHCEQEPNGQADPLWLAMREYVAQVRLRTAFGIPAVMVNLTCGGVSAS